MATTAQQAYAPGNLAANAVAGALGLPSTVAQIPGVPSLSMNSSSSSAGESVAGFDNSAFDVNFGSGSAGGGGGMLVLLAGAALLAAVAAGWRP